MTSVLETAGRDSGRPSHSATGEHAAGLPRIRGASYLLAFLLLSLFALAPLSYPGYFQVHSGFLPILNLADLAASPDKLHWLPGIGVGHDLLRGDGPLAYWLALPFSFVLGNIGATKFVFALSMLLGGLGSLALVHRLVQGYGGREPLAWRAGLLAGIIFLLWPPLLAAVYVRGALAETLFMGLLPWVLFLLTADRQTAPGSEPAVAREDLPAAGASDDVGRNTMQVTGDRLPGLGSLVAIALIVGLSFFAQAGLALWAVPLVLAWALWAGRGWGGRLAGAGAVLVGAAAGGGLFWWLHRSAGLGGLGGPDFAAHAVYPYQLLSAYWGYGISTPGWRDGLPLQLGLAAVGLAMLSSVLLVGQRGIVGANSQADKQSRGLTAEPSSPRPSTSHPASPLLGALSGVLRGHPAVETFAAVPPSVPRASTFALAATLILVFLTTTLARPLWSVFPGLARPLTYPWQLNALIGPWLALLAAAVVVLERRLAQLTVWAGLVALVVLGSYSYLAPRFTAVQPDLDDVAIFGEDQAVLLTAQVDRASAAEDQAADQGSKPAILAGEVMTVTVNWQALQPLDFDYNVFVHAVDKSDAIVVQWDGQPQRDGQPYPMTTWPVGEVVPDAYVLALDDEAAARVARVHAGLYNWQTGQRLSVDGGDHVALEVVVGER